MRLRVRLANFLLRLGRFIHSLAIMVMRTDDLVEFGRRSYAGHPNLDYWTSDEVVAPGLNPLESALLEKIPIRSGRLLVLGLGGGRDAIPLARLGFEVTGIDFIPAMVQRAVENAARHGVQVLGLVQEVSELEVPAHSFDCVWLANSMYSSVPTRARRVAMLRRLKQALKPGGYFFCSFHWERRGEFSPIARLARRILALLTLGNLNYEPGDILWGDEEFIHAFSAEDELQSEFAQGGFAVLQLQLPTSGVEGGALLVSQK